MAQNICKCFVSHTSKDIENVRELKRRLEAADPQRKLKIWIYEDDTEAGRPLKSLAHDIRDCDFFIVFLSEESTTKEFVQRELGEALALNRERAGEGEERPIILGISASNEPAGGWNVPVRDFKTGAPTGETYRFSEERYYKLHMPHIDRIEQLAQYMSPRILFWGKDFKTDAELFRTGVFDIYKRFFPEEEERDDPADICQWLANESWRKDNFDYGRDRRPHKLRILERVSGDWGSVFGVLVIAERAVAMVYLTAHLRSGWIFGNYFGVLQSWRAHERAKSFIDEVVEHTRENLGGFKGVVFEVERYTDRALEDALARVESIEDGDEAALGEHAETVRAVMRIRLYQKNGALLLVNRKLRRIEYRQPAMNDLEDGEALTQDWIDEHEWPLWLMVWPIDLKERQEVDLGELIDFIYLDLFGSYSALREPLFKAWGLSFWKYLRRLRDKCLAANGGRFWGRRSVKALCVRDLKPAEKALWTAVMKKRLDIKL
jgi:hypothetical protein